MAARGSDRDGRACRRWGGGGRGRLDHDPTRSGRVVRTTIQTSGATALVNSPRAGGSLAITPDGSRIVYTAAGQLVVRRLDQFEATPLISLGSPTQPFISPDGQWVGFFDGRVLKKVAMTGGPPVTVFEDNKPMGGPLGATWGADGTIVYTGSGGAGLRRVSAGGGEAETLTTPDRAQGEVRHVRPEFLPGGRALLFTIGYAGRGPDGTRIAVLDLETGAKTVLLTGRHAKYLRSGHLVYGTEGTLRAVVFDLEQRTVVGAPVPLLAPVAVNSQGARMSTTWLTMGRSCICRRTSRPRPHARSCGSTGRVARRRSAPKLTRTSTPDWRPTERAWPSSMP